MIYVYTFIYEYISIDHSEICVLTLILHGFKTSKFYQFTCVI